MNEINSKSFNINIDKPTIADLEVYFQKHSASLDALRQSMQKATEKIVDLKAVIGEIKYEDQYNL